MTVSTVTIYDIARLAGVSPATVSRVLNQSTLVREETRRRVVEAAERLAYQPPARAPRSRSATTVAVVVSDLLNPCLARTIKGIQTALAAEGASMIVCDYDGKMDEELAILRELRGRGVDGLILSSPHFQSEHVMIIRQLRMPAVLFYTYVTETDIPCVYINNVEAALEMVQYLVRLGHRRIGVIRGPMGDLTTSRQRMEGCRLAYKSFGLTMDDELIAEGDFSVEGGYDAALQLLEAPRPPTAIFAFSDTMAVGALKAARDRNVAVPGELSVVGFDDIPLAALVDPGLTTVSQPMLEVGQEAAGLLLALIGGAEPDRLKRTLAHRVVVRGSSGPPPARVQTA